MKIAVVSVTKNGDIIARRLKESFDVDIFSNSLINDFNIMEITGRLFKNYRAIIFISSTGIAVRASAPFLRGKDKDPAVLVIDSLGKFVISLLSGHLGGANELTYKVAHALHSEPVITTATDNLHISAPDVVALKNNLVIDSLAGAKIIAASLVGGRKVAFVDEKNIIGLPDGYTNNYDICDAAVFVTDKIIPHRKKIKDVPILRLIRKDLVIGIGCRKNFESQKMIDTVINVLKEYNFDYRAVRAVCTAEIKAHEEAIVELSKFLKCGLNVYTMEQIKKIQYRYEGSSFVEKAVGVRAVCEPCVELSGAKLITNKIKCNSMTICIGEKVGD